MVGAGGLLFGLQTPAACGLLCLLEALLIVVLTSAPCLHGVRVCYTARPGVWLQLLPQVMACGRSSSAAVVALLGRTLASLWTDCHGGADCT